MAPKDIQVIGNELAILWGEGEEDYIGLEYLRRACPCAVCGGEPDVMGKVIRPEVTYSAKSFELVGYQITGGYAFQPRWGDGHQTGLYSWEYLKALGRVVRESA